MEKDQKIRMNFMLNPENAIWLRNICKQSGISMSLFMDALLTGARYSVKEDVNEREAVSMALEHIVKGLRD